MREYSTFKDVFFNNEDEARRFKLLYGGSISSPGTYTSIFGSGVASMWEVTLRVTKDEFFKIKNTLNLKKKKGESINKHKYSYYVFEG